jgi:hypothetical protein
MQQLKTRPAILAIVLALVMGVIIGGTAVAATQVHMRNARADLTSAWNELNVATPDKAGHRVQAMNLVHQALNQVNLGIEAGAY